MWLNGVGERGAARGSVATRGCAGNGRVWGQRAAMRGDTVFCSGIILDGGHA